MSDIIPEAGLRALEESFGNRFMRHGPGGEKGEEPSASVFPQSVEEVELLSRLAADHRIPLVARGAGTAIYPGRMPPAVAVRFDEMRHIRLPDVGDEDWVEVEPGVVWSVLEDRLGARGMGPRVYPTSAPRSTVGGWLSENGLGIGSYEYGWLLQNVLRVEAVLAGGERSVVEGEDLRHFIGSRGGMGFLVRARLGTRPVSDDVPAGAIFRETGAMAGAVLDLYRRGVPLWHLGFVNAAMARAAGLEAGNSLLGVYPAGRGATVEPALRSTVESHDGRLLSRDEAASAWEKRFFPASPLGPTPAPGRGFVRGARLGPTLLEIERNLEGVALGGTVSVWGEVALLAFGAAEGREGLENLSAITDLELVRLAGRSWMPEQR